LSGRAQVPNISILDYLMSRCFDVAKFCPLVVKLLPTCCQHVDNNVRVVEFGVKVLGAYRHHSFVGPPCQKSS